MFVEDEVKSKRHTGEFLKKIDWTFASESRHTSFQRILVLPQATALLRFFQVYSIDPRSSSFALSIISSLFSLSHLVALSRLPGSTKT